MISRYTVDLLIKKDTPQATRLLIDTISREKQALRAKQRYYRTTAGVTSDIIVNSERYKSIEKDIQTLTTIMKQLKVQVKDPTKHFQSFRLIQYVNKQQVKPKREDVKIYVEKVVQQNILDVIDNMFYKVRFAGLDKATLLKFDRLFKKFNLSLTDEIKEEIKNQYKNWGSDTALVSLSNIVNDFHNKAESEEITEQDRAELLELIKELKAYTGV